MANDLLMPIQPIGANADRNRMLNQYTQNPMTHNALQSPYQQFQQNFPAVDQYGRDVLSGRIAAQGLNQLAQNLQQAGTNPQVLEQYLGIGGMTKPAIAINKELIDTVVSTRGEPVRAINEIRVAKKPEPIKAFHSTSEEFAEFDPSKGIGGQMWFTSRKDLAEKGYEGAQKGRLVEAQVDIRNPAGWEEYDKFSLDELMAQGYDGLKLSEEGEDVYVAFFPEQVKVLANKPVKN